MDKTSVSVARASSATSGARDFLEAPGWPAIAAQVAVHDGNPKPPGMRAPDLNGDTGGFGRPLVNRLATTTVTRHAPGSTTATAPTGLTAHGIHRPVRARPP